MKRRRGRHWRPGAAASASAARPAPGARCRRVKQRLVHGGRRRAGPGVGTGPAVSWSCSCCRLARRCSAFPASHGGGGCWVCLCLQSHLSVQTPDLACPLLPVGLKGPLCPLFTIELRQRSLPTPGAEAVPGPLVGTLAAQAGTPAGTLSIDLDVFSCPLPTAPRLSRGPGILNCQRGWGQARGTGPGPTRPGRSGRAGRRGQHEALPRSDSDHPAPPSLNPTPSESLGFLLSLSATSTGGYMCDRDLKRRTGSQGRARPSTRPLLFTGAQPRLTKHCGRPFLPRRPHNGDALTGGGGGG
jgi:hypothetical protein